MEEKKNFCEITVFPSFSRLSEKGKVVIVNTDYIEHIDVSYRSVTMAGGKEFNTNSESLNRLLETIGNGAD